MRPVGLANTLKQVHPTADAIIVQFRVHMANGGDRIQELRQRQHFNQLPRIGQRIDYHGQRQLRQITKCRTKFYIGVCGGWLAIHDVNQHFLGLRESNGSKQSCLLRAPPWPATKTLQTLLINANNHHVTGQFTTQQGHHAVVEPSVEAFEPLVMRGDTCKTNHHDHQRDQFEQQR